MLGFCKIWVKPANLGHTLAVSVVPKCIFFSEEISVEIWWSSVQLHQRQLR